MLDDQPVIWRGQEHLDAQPVTSLADALAGLIRGTYPDPPDGTWWYFGHPDGPRTISKAAPRGYVTIDRDDR